MKYDCLILDVNYKPYDIWDWQHAISKLLCTNSVKEVYGINGPLNYDKTIKDGRGNEYVLPAVLALTTHNHKHDGLATYTKMNIYYRDRGICQYCGEFVGRESATIDHVIPRAHWNPKRYHFRLSSFENVVTACPKCNKKKRNRTPMQANMQLVSKPKRISRAEAYRNKLSMIKNRPEQWNLFLKVNHVEEKTA